MPDPVTGIIGATTVGGTLLQADAQRSATNKAAGASQAATDEAMRISNQRYNEGMALLQPYLNAGTGALSSFQALGGFYDPATGSVPRTYDEYVASIPKVQEQRVAIVPQGYTPSASLSRQNQKLPSKIGLFGDRLSSFLADRLVENPNYSPLNMRINKFEWQKAREMADQLRANKQIEQQQQQAQAQQLQPQQPQIMTREQFLAQQQQDAFNAQQREVQNIERSPLFNSLVRQGEDALLQNASATGGMRGGNIQGALAYYRPQMLQQQIDKRMGYADLLAGRGQQAASTAMAAGQNVAQNQAGLLTANGTNQGNAAITQGNIQSNMFGNIMQTVGGLQNPLSNFLGGGGSNTNANNYVVSPGSTSTAINFLGNRTFS